MNIHQALSIVIENAEKRLQAMKDFKDPNQEILDIEKAIEKVKNWTEGQQ